MVEQVENHQCPSLSERVVRVEEQIKHLQWEVRAVLVVVGTVIVGAAGVQLFS